MSSRNGGVGVREARRPGQHNRGSEDVAGIQRARILAAMMIEVSERGVGNVTVAHVVSRSGVSRRTFYELFADREECFLAAFDKGIARVASVLAPAYESRSRWVERVRDGLLSLLELLDGDRGLARLLVVESLAAGPKALERRARVLGELNRVVDEGRTQARAVTRGAPAATGVEQAGIALPTVTAEGAVGAVLAVLHGRLTSDGQESLLGLAGPLMSMIVLPYLGSAAARRELERPAPPAKAGVVPRPVVNPLHELGMRLTYRTIRVLMAVAEDPGSSNRVVSEGAGISDQGQVSKLLARLDRVGLVQNMGVAQEHGTPNAWMLTERGREVHGALAH
jgi:AcrR family transcriptional regulator